MNDSYAPSFLVRQTHDILHLDASLHRVDNTFNISVNSYLNDYSKSLIPVPAILMSLGLLAIIVLWFVHLIRFCGKFCCASHEADVDAIHGHNASKFGWLPLFFYFFLFLTLLADQILLFGNSYLSDGVNTAKDAIDYMNNLGSTLLDQGYLLQNYGTVLYTDFQSASSSGTCVIPNEYLAYVDDYNSYIQTFVDYVSPIPNQCTNINDGLDKWGITYKNQSIWVLYGFLIILIAFYAIGVFFKNKCLFFTGVGFAEMWMVIIFLAVGVELVILVRNIYSW